MIEPGLADELLCDEQLEQVAQGWAAAEDDALKVRPVRSGGQRLVAWAAAASFVVGVLSAGAFALFSFRDTQVPSGGSAYIVSFDLLRDARQEVPTRTVSVDSGVDFIVIELPTHASDGESLAIALRNGNGESSEFNGWVRDGFASVVVPIAAVPEGRYAVRSAHANDPTFELELRRNSAP